MLDVRNLDPKVLGHLTAEERTTFLGLLARQRRLWTPNAGTQTMAYTSQADVIGFGGAAGGGKTELALGLAVTEHRVVGYCRKNGTELTAVRNRLAEIVGAEAVTKDEANFTRPDGVPVRIEFMAFPDPGDVQKYRGRPHDLLVFDEAATLRFADVRFLMGWLRTVDPSQRCRVVMPFNPPDTVEGRWVLHYFAPWLDPKHPRPAVPGELRWFVVLDGIDTEVSSGAPIMHKGEQLFPQSRTFIPSRVTDNPYLMGTNYVRQLQALPEPQRSQLLYGDFRAGVKDPAEQVIPTAWIEAAMARWRPLVRLPLMDSMGADVARGGGDRSVLFMRYGMWFSEPAVFPGAETPDGPAFAARVVQHLRDNAPVHLDVIGVGSSPYDHLRQIGVHIVGVNVAEKTGRTDRSGRLRFKNVRSELVWRAREAFDPQNATNIAIPPSAELLAELAAYTWEAPGGVITVCDRDKLIEVLGRSPDLASAFFLALMDTPPVREIPNIFAPASSKGFDYDPYKDV